MSLVQSTVLSLFVYPEYCTYFRSSVPGTPSAYLLLVLVHASPSNSSEFVRSLVNDAVVRGSVRATSYSLHVRVFVPGIVQYISHIRRE